MPRILSTERLLRVSKSVSQTIENWKEGVALENDSGIEISQIMLAVAGDRWRLGRDHLRQADKFMLMTPSLCRSAISRYYYAMYHSLRACVFVSHRGDDHEKHSTLPTKIPLDFEDRESWSNKLKVARELRNRADYDPYPKSNSAWMRDASELQANAKQFLRICRAYLKNKGCEI